MLQMRTFSSRTPRVSVRTTDPLRLTLETSSHAVPVQSDELLAEQIFQKVRFGAGVPVRRLTVNVRAGHVVMLGTVSSYYAKQKAQQAVISLPGVNRVENRLEVV